MNYKAKQCINNAVSDLDHISHEINEIASELNRYKGIGNQICSRSLLQISDKYKSIKYKLKSLD